MNVDRPDSLHPLGVQARRWALRAGRDGASLRLAGELAQALGEALAAGHSCLPLAPERCAAALATGIVGQAVAPGSHPLVLDPQGRLYLHRQFDHERRLAQRLVALAGRPVDDSACAGVGPAIGDAGQNALAQALRRRLVVISGGPGTGKTSAVVRLLASLLGRDAGLRIVLAAPTGKAAARLQEAIHERSGDLPDLLRERLPAQATTVHRLLGQDARGGVRHHAGRPLLLDVLVIDEASMLDLALASRLCEALPAHARLILLGDRDQLAAVESGAVFAELAGLPAAHPLRQGVVQFERQYRFAADAPIARLSSAVRAGAWPEAQAVLAQGGTQLCWRSPSPAAAGAPDDALLIELEQGYQAYWQALVDGDRPDRVFAAFARFRVLCALRAGPWGSEMLAERLSQRARGRLDAPLPPGLASAWYRGRPVMVLRNDPLLQVFNGDIGIALPDPEGELGVCFPLAGGGYRWVATVRLPPHETAFAISVHKSQGSEFERVAVVLPPEASPVLSREMLYTAVTRSRGALLLVAPAARLAEAIGTPTVRNSGLRDRIDEALAAQPGEEPAGATLVPARDPGDHAVPAAPPADPF